MTEIIIVTIALGISSAIFCYISASEKSRDANGWAAAGFLFPLLSLIAIAGLPANTGGGRRTMRCLTCREPLYHGGVVCPFCGADLKT